MKTPFQAFVICPPRSVLLPSVTVLPCVVTMLMPVSQTAFVEVHSLLAAGRVTKVVPYADLASTLEKAIEEATARIRRLPVLEFKTFPGMDEKAAAVAPLAGDTSGKTL